MCILNLSPATGKENAVKNGSTEDSEDKNGKSSEKEAESSVAAAAGDHSSKTAGLATNFFPFPLSLVIDSQIGIPLIGENIVFFRFFQQLSGLEPLKSFMS